MNADKTDTTMPGLEMAKDIPSFVQKQYKIPFYQRLRVKLVLFIGLAVAITEILIFIPSLANMQDRWLQNKHHAAQALSLVFINGQKNIPPKALNQEVLSSTIFSTIHITFDDGSQFNLGSVEQPAIRKIIDLNLYGEIESILGALTTLLLHNTEGLIRLTGPIANTNANLTITFPAAALYGTLVEFTWQFILTSFSIAIVAATLIYLITYELLVRPLRSIHENMLNFVIEPDNPNRIIIPEQRNDEVGIAQCRIAAIQTALQKNYVRQKHLAGLGLAVAKINHDMRNVLASAQVISDYLTTVDNPTVQSLTPKLIRTINRAINYTQNIISYGRTQEQLPQRRHLLLHHLVDEVVDSLAVTGKDEVRIRNLVPENFQINADSEQLHRVITNLCRNAVEAMTAKDHERNCTVKEISIAARRIGATAIIDVEDTGPGLPAKAKEYLFAPFQGSTRHDGFGLGLAICLELVRAHGGTIKLLEDGRPGTHFEIRIPDRPASIAKWSEKKTA